MSDQPDKPEDGDSASGEPALPEPELLKADDVHLPDPDVSADAVEPVLGTSPEEVRLSEPSLDAAEISPDSAQATSLDEVAAEAQSVAREAEEVGTLVSGARPAGDPAEIPAEAPAPAGTAPAGGTAGDMAEEPAETGAMEATSPEDDTAIDGEAIDGEAAGEGDVAPGLASLAAPGGEPTWTGREQDQSRWDALFDAGQSTESAEAPDTTGAEGTSGVGEDRTANNLPADIPAPPATAPWAHPFPTQGPQAPGSPVPPVGGPYGLPPAGAEEAPPTRIRARAVGRSTPGSNRKKLLILGLAGLLLLALLIFAITAIVNALQSDDSGTGSSATTTPGADGIIAENISPLDLEAGTCVLGFDSTNVSADVTTVTCTTPHNAQLLATTSLPDDSDFPGEATLNASGDELCNSVTIDENTAAGYTGLTLTQVTPTSGTWADGDRRIDCFVVSDEGNVITDTLLAE